MALVALPSSDRDSRGPAQVAALGALLAGVALMVYGIVSDAMSGAADDPSRTAFVVGAAAATFGALLALLAPGLYGPGASAARRFAQIAVPVAMVAIVCPAVAVLAAAGLGQPVASANAPGAASATHAGHDGAGFVPAADMQRLQDAIAGGVATTVAGAGVGTTTPPGQAPTFGMSPLATTPAAGAGGGSLEDQLGRVLTSMPPTSAAPAAAAAPSPAAPGAAANQALAEGVAQHSHGVATPEQPLDRETRAALGQQLTVARGAALRYPTVADAEAAGYTKVTGYLALIGAHFVKWGLMDATFDPNEPEMLLYDGTDPGSSVVGLSYYVFSPSEPAGFAGPNDHWHQHIGLCLRDGVVVGGETLTAAECASRGGSKAQANDGWMVHAWVVPGWDSPQGVFSPEHPGLT